jgi:hypothetical protein
MINAAFIRSNNYEKAASAVRDWYAVQFSSSDVVPWQWKMICLFTVNTCVVSVVAMDTSLELFYTK